MHNGHHQPTPQEVADTLLVTAAVAAKQREDAKTATLMREFVKDRNAELQRVKDQVVIPHMRGWAKEWFAKHDLPLPPEADTDKPIVFAG